MNIITALCIGGAVGFFACAFLTKRNIDDLVSENMDLQLRIRELERKEKEDEHSAG